MKARRRRFYRQKCSLNRGMQRHSEGIAELVHEVVSPKAKAAALWASIVKWAFTPKFHARLKKCSCGKMADASGICAVCAKRIVRKYHRHTEVI